MARLDTSPPDTPQQTHSKKKEGKLHGKRGRFELVSLP